MAGSMSDITGAKVADPLTGLPNQVLFLDRMEQLRRGSGPGESCTVLFLDLDGFKTVNESLGQAVGDDLLRAVAARLQDALDTTPGAPARSTAPGAPRLSDPTLARLGSDEFVILLPETGVFDAMRAADRLQQSLAPACVVGGGDVFVTASIGVAISTSDDERPQDVVRNAGTAMARAKGLGKGRVEVFDPAMRDRVTERFRLDTALRLALDRHEFEPFYQPIISLTTGKLSGFEALMRWRHPERGIVMPAEFIAAIEDNGLISAIGRRFFADVCRQMRAWRDQWPGAAALSVNVNFAGPQLDEPGLVAQLLQILDETGVDRSKIVVEVTESTAISDLTHAVEVLREIRDAGVRVVLDDFGTGYSSLGCLQSLPITGLKLDRSFIAGRHAHPEIVRAVVALARHLSLAVTAEGVATVEQCEQLRRLGCDFAQGFLFDRPQEASVAGALIGEGRSWLPEPHAVIEA